MKRHEVTEAEFDKWALDHWVRFASSAGEFSNKFLEVNMSQPMFRVMDHGKTLYVGGVKATAIAEYNKAP